SHAAAVRSSVGDRLWVADMTYVRTWAGFLYRAVVLDAWSRRVIGWAMESHLRTELVLAALNMAVAQPRPPTSFIIPTTVAQYTSLAFGRRVERPPSGLRWAARVTRTTMHCARASSPRSSASSSIATGSGPNSTPGWRSSTSLKAGTTRGG